MRTKSKISLPLNSRQVSMSNDYCQSKSFIQQFDRMNILYKDQPVKKSTVVAKTRQQIELPKINKHLPVDKNNFYQQRYEWLTRSNDYILLSNQEIQQEFQFLKRQLIAINDEAYQNDRNSVKGLKHSRQLSVASKQAQNRDREIENNNAIIYRLKIEYELLQKRVYANQNGGKQQLGNVFAQIKQKIQKTKQKIKQLKLKSKSIGENIQNGQDIFAEVNKLERQRDVQATKKLKMQQKLAFSQADLQRLELKLQQINEQHAEAERYLQDQSFFDRQDEQEKKLQNIYRQKSYQLQIVRKTIQSTKNMKQQKYHQLLKQLQQMVNRLKQKNQHFDKLQLKNTYQKKQIIALEQTLSQLISIYKQRSKTTDNNNEAVFNGIDLEHILERDDSQQQGMMRKIMPLIQKPASPGRSYRRHSDFSIDSLRNKNQKRKDMSSRTQNSIVTEVDINTEQKSKQLIQKTIANSSIQTNQRLPIVKSEGEAGLKFKSNQLSLNRGQYYRNYKNLTQQKNQLLQKLQVTLITNAEHTNRFTIDQKLSQKQQIFEDTIEQSSNQPVPNQPQEPAAVTQEDQILEVIDQQAKQPPIPQNKIDYRTLQANKKELINNQIQQFQQEEVLEDQKDVSHRQSSAKLQNFD